MPPPLIASLIPSAQLIQNPQNSTKFEHCKRSPAAESKAISRRNAAVLLSSIISPFILHSLVNTPQSEAISLGISGPKDWLREQKKKSEKFLLAPVDASRNILHSAYLLLMKSEVEFRENDLDEFQEMLKSASRDCVPEDRNSFVVFQANTGVEVCTFRLIVKNASSLLDDKDLLKLEAEAKLSDLIRSFTFLNGMAREEDAQLTSNRQRVADALKDTISSLNNFEQGIKDCIEV